MKKKFSFLKLSEWFTYISVVLIGFIMILGVADIIGSKVFKQGVPETSTITALCHVILVTAPLAYITLTRGHIEIDIIERRFPPKFRTAVIVFVYILSALLSAFICFRGFSGFISACIEGTSMGADVSIPVWFFYLMLTINFGLTAVAFLIKLPERIKNPD
jgi:TRAP-type C4-dicarboxylate transport system permease small subunit